MNRGKFECCFGFHTYEIPDKDDSDILMCKYCKKYGYYNDNDGYEYWSEYDNKGNIIHYKDSRGYERWSEYDNKGNEIYCKYSDGHEMWKNNKGYWVYEKPENWIYEKFLETTLNNNLTKT